ncbi:MAG: family 10 glycosylhydrolase [Bacilli bacterium]|nr:family 10 glycosylhydrolase [Bacilli bacterium]
MKRILSCLLVLMSCFVLSLTFNVKAETEVSLEGIEEMRGVWVSTVGNLDFRIKQNTTSEKDILKWKTYFLDILEQVEANNLNAIFFQVRPNNDAFYESEYNAWSSYLIGYGEPVGWDPVEWMVKECHVRGIEFHAWLNPYRIGTASTDINVLTATEDEINEVKMDYAKTLKNRVKQTVNNPLLNIEDEQAFYDNIILGDDNVLRLNPASEAVITHIVKTVEEIAVKYDVDGIHYDDYFYPSGKWDTFSEDRMYAEYIENGGTLKLEDWRRDNVSRMVKQVSDVVTEVNKKYDKNVSFGISPAPVWAPNPEFCTDGRGLEGGQDVPCGSYSCYHDLYADTKLWVEEEWIDYILPQVYSSLDGTYPTLVKWWADVVSRTNVKLYLGTALYHIPDGTFKATEIYDQMKWVRSNPEVKENVSGYVFFSYQSFVRASHSSLIFVRQYFKNDAITPVSLPVDNPGNESGKLNCVELTNNYNITITEVSDAKGYLLYAFDKGEARVYDKNHLVGVYSQTTGDGLHSYATVDKTEKEFVLKTLNLNNEVVTTDATISTLDATVNQAPTVSLSFEMPEYFLMGESVEIKVSATDDATTNLTVTMYHALDGETFRDAVEMTMVSPGVYSTTWEAFGLSEEDNSRFKIVVTDGDKTSEIITEYFKVYEKAPVKEYTVVFKDKDGNILKEEKVTEGSSATAPSAPSVEGYIFEKWSTDFSNVTEDLEVTAIYTAEAIVEPGNSCKKDFGMVVVGLIVMATMGVLVLKRENLR